MLRTHGVWFRERPLVAPGGDCRETARPAGAGLGVSGPWAQGRGAGRTADVGLVSRGA